MRVELLGKTPMYCFQWDYIDSNMYVVVEDEWGLVIDPILTEEVKKFVLNKKIQKFLILLTHEHFDHINGLNWFREQFPCSVYANETCAENIRSESKNLSDKSEIFFMFHPEIKNRNMKIMPFYCKVDEIIRGGGSITWEGHSIEFMDTPGHTDGSMCIVFDKKYLFTGDTLLLIPTITRLPGGSKKKFETVTIPLLKSIQTKIVKVYPGHGDFGKLEEML